MTSSFSPWCAVTRKFLFNVTILRILRQVMQYTAKLMHFFILLAGKLLASCVKSTAATSLFPERSGDFILLATQSALVVVKQPSVLDFGLL